MSQEKRLLLAVVLSIGTFLGYYYFFAPAPAPLTTAPVTQQSAKTTLDPAPSVSDTDLAAGNQDQHEAVTEEKSIAVDTPVAKVVLSTRGAVLKSYALKNYHKDVSKDSGLKDLLLEGQGSSALFVGLQGYQAFTEDKVFELVSDVEKNDAREITLAWQNSDIRFEKIFIFGGQSSDYGLRVDYKVTNRSGHALAFSPYLATTLKQKDVSKSKGGVFSFLKFEQPDLFSWTYFKDKKFHSDMNWEKFQGSEMFADASWAALADRYFIFAMMPPEDITASAEPLVAVKFDRQNEFLTGRILQKQNELPKGATVAGSFRAYLGPKIISELSGFGVSLGKSVDYGWFSFLAIPILWLMTFLHRVIPSWGFVIIALTFLLKLVLHPVNKKSMTSMKAMQQLQPKIQEMKKKYPDDKQKQQMEMMQLFKTHKVNPLGGCLPMLLQMPIYIVLYKVLWNAIELYHAPFFFYKDLSAPDPYFLSPILLGVFMFLQQKLTPSATADETQQKMMLIMPIMFTAFMLFLPVGLVLYIFVNTVVSVLQQFMMKRDLSFKDLFTGKWQPNGA